VLDNFDKFIPAANEYIRFLPEIILTGFGLILMILEAITAEERKNLLSGVAIFGLVAALEGALIAHTVPGLAFNNMLIVDNFATFFRVLVIGVALLTLLCSTHYLRLENANTGEYYALLLFSVVGQSIMASANELIMVFIGLEISSISSYILAGYLRDDKRNNEAALKYFLLGSFATAFLLYGIAWIYGMTGSTNLAVIRQVLMLPATSSSMALIGTAAALMFVGFAFKISAAPFQIWAPDVYQGAPAPVAAFLSTGPKAAAFAVFIRVFITAFGPIANRWEPIVWGSAILTMVIGNFAALTQSNIKRLLAYSSIAHAGYLLVAVTANSEIGTAAAMFYLAAYALMQIGAFAVITYFARQGEKYVNVEDLSGLGARQPLVAAMLTIFLLSLIGVPLTGGFFGKFYIFRAALDSNLVWLTIIGLLNSAVAAYYYLRIIVVMYFNEPGEGANTVQPMTLGLRIAMLASAAGTVILGIFPAVILNFAGKSAMLVK
jgi:NADH-quinone oxidoreductase subunit N